MKIEPRNYEKWLKDLTTAHLKGWKAVGDWRKYQFQSPSGTVHDLSAADFDSLDYIEKNGSFLVKD